MFSGNTKSVFSPFREGWPIAQMSTMLPKILAKNLGHEDEARLSLLIGLSWNPREKPVSLPPCCVELSMFQLVQATVWPTRVGPLPKEDLPQEFVGRLKDSPHTSHGLFCAARFLPTLGPFLRREPPFVFPWLNSRSCPSAEWPFDCSLDPIFMAARLMDLASLRLQTQQVLPSAQ